MSLQYPYRCSSLEHSTSHAEAEATQSFSGHAQQDWRMAGLRAESGLRANLVTVHRSDQTVVDDRIDRGWNSAKA